MKRISLHIIFWLVYQLQDILLQYTWNMNDLTLDNQFWRAVATSFVVLPAKLMVVYYFLYRALPKLGNPKASLFWSLTGALAIFFAGLAIYRLIGYYVITPVIYSNHWTQTFSSLRDFFATILQIGYVTGIAVALKFARLRYAALERDKILIKEKLETELKFLRNQTNPHFLMNTLNNIYALARKKSDDAPEAILKLSDLLQFILYKSTSPYISLGEEVRVIEHYLKLEQLRYTDRLDISFKKKIDSGLYHISPLLLLPFVENAFKHGISETRFETYIHIKLEVEDGILQFEIENSKENADLTGDENKIGLNNVQRQLELTYKDFKLDVENKETHFKVYLHIDLHQLVEF